MAIKTVEEMRKDAKEILKKADELERLRECHVGKYIMKQYRANLLDENLRQEIERLFLGGGKK